MPKKNLSIFQDVESIAQVTLQWKQHVRSSMKSARNFDINHQKYAMLILSYVNIDNLKILFTLNLILPLQILNAMAIL